MSQSQPQNSYLANAYLTVGILVLFALTASLAIYLQNRLPEVVSESAPATEFSAARALQQLRVISAQPRPIGSHQHAIVRDYILHELSGLGFVPEIQKTISVKTGAGSLVTAGTVENVLTRIEGKNSGKAILLVCHYDSVPGSFGASDDGAGVVTLLEVARALKANGPLSHDVILLFTDGEEVGLLGANAFTSHPWSKEVGLVLNFEARGNGGPVLMFQTSSGNNELIRQFQQASPGAIASSFSYEIYKRLPNDTDFTILDRLGVPGLNFAFIDGINHYHTALDNVDEINPRTLQSLGSNALAVTKHFGDTSLISKTGDAVYFNVLGSNLVRYSQGFTIPVLVFTVLLFVFVIWQGIRKGQISFAGILWGFLGLLASMAISALATWSTWWLTVRLRSSLRSVPWTEPYNSNSFRIAFVLCALAITSTIYLMIKRRDWMSLTVGALLWWLILSVLGSFAMPGGSYLFTLPLLFSLIGLALFPKPSQNSELIAAITVFPGIILWAPMLYNLFVSLTLNSAWLVTIFAVLLFGLALAPIVNALAFWKWRVPSLLLLAAIVLVVIGISSSHFDKSRPKTNNLFYAQNADTGQAVFASSDEKTDEWTGQFLSNGMKRAAMTEFFPGTTRTYWQSPVTAAPFAGPEAVLTSDQIDNGVRTLSLKVTSPRHAPVISIYANPDTVIDAAVDGKRAISSSSSPVKNWGMQFYALPPEGIELMLKTRSDQPFKLLLVDRSYGLSEITSVATRPRPDHTIATPYAISDVTLVAKSFTF